MSGTSGAYHLMKHLYVLCMFIILGFKLKGKTRMMVLLGFDLVALYLMLNVYTMDTNIYIISSGILAHFTYDRSDKKRIDNEVYENINIQDEEKN